MTIRKEFLILFCSMLIGAAAAGFMAGFTIAGSARRTAWWNLLYERPNPERLPVRVHFLWAENGHE